MDINNMIKCTKMFTKAHSSQILVAVGIAGMAGATITAYKAGTKASRIIKEESRIAEQNGVEYTSFDAIKDTWTCWAPPMAMFTVSAAAIIGANKMDYRKNAALATAYKLSETSFREYRSKMVEKLGEKKENGVLGDIAKKHFEENPPEEKEIIITPAGGDCICYDPCSGRYFKSSPDAIQKAVNELNKRIYGDMEMYASLNDFYDLLGLPRISIGDDLGWNADTMLEVRYGYCGDENNNPCLEMGFAVDPRFEYELIH